MVNEFCGFKHGVIGTDKMPADTTLNNTKKADLIKLLHTAQHNYETLMWFYNNAVKANMSQLNNNGWIPYTTNGELPKEGQRVWLSFTNEVTSHVKDAWWQGKFFVWNNCHIVKDTPTAWKPYDIPAPYIPKQEEQKGIKK